MPVQSTKPAIVQTIPIDNTMPAIQPDIQPVISNNNQSYDTDAQVRYAKAKRAAYDYWKNAIYGHTTASLDSNTINKLLYNMWKTWEQYDVLPSKGFMDAFQSDMVKNIPVTASIPNPPVEVSIPNPPVEVSTSNTTHIIGIPNSSTIYKYNSEEYERYKRAKSEMFAAWRYATRGLTKASFNNTTTKLKFDNMWKVWTQYDKLPPIELMRALENNMYNELPNEDNSSQPILQSSNEASQRSHQASLAAWESAMAGQTNPSNELLAAAYNAVWKAWELYSPLPSPEFRKRAENELYQSILKQSNSVSSDKAPHNSLAISEQAGLAAWKSIMVGQTNPSNELLAAAYNAFWKEWELYSPIPSPEFKKNVEDNLYQSTLKQNTSANLNDAKKRSKQAGLDAWESAMAGQTNPSNELLAAAYNAVWRAWELYSPLPSPEVRKESENRLYQMKFNRSPPRPVNLDRNSNDAEERSKQASMAAWESAMAGQTNPHNELLTEAYNAVWRAWELYSPLPSPEDRKRAENELYKMTFNRSPPRPVTQEEIQAAQLQAAQLQAAQLQAAQLQAAQIGVAQAMPAQIGVAQAMPAQIGVAQAMPAQIGVAQAMPAQIGVAQAMPIKESLTNRYRNGNSAARKPRSTTYNTYGTQTRSGFTDLDLRRVLY
jgi:hypothetical protein